jgi:hypothetical protein
MSPRAILVLIAIVVINTFPFDSELQPPSIILEFHEQGCLEVTATNQVMLDPTTKCLAFGDVTAPVVTSQSG